MASYGLFIVGHMDIRFLNSLKESQYEHLAFQRMELKHSLMAGDYKWIAIQMIMRGAPNMPIWDFWEEARDL